MLKGIDTSAIKYITALSPTAISAAGCTNPVDLSGATFATVIMDTGSTAAAAITADVLRSSASNGTFHNFGASLPAPLLGMKHVRSFVTGSSDVWYRVFYQATGAASPSMAISFAVAGQREVPIDQNSSAPSTSSFSVINSA
jgi:hypothetical protein